MTVNEFSNEFDVLIQNYNTLTNANFELDEYEKSVFLTRAQLEIVKDSFRNFEKDSKVRTDLKELVKDYKSTDKVGSVNTLSDKSTFFNIPSNVFLILQEQCVLEDSNKCINGKVVSVKPKTHDEYNSQINNPFKKPDSSVVWRLDYQSQDYNLDNVELISEYDISQYNLRYISFPEPIVLLNLSTKDSGEGLSIDGVSLQQTCKLSENIHREILDRAFQLALLQYSK